MVLSIFFFFDTRVNLRTALAGQLHEISLKYDWSRVIRSSFTREASGVLICCFISSVHGWFVTFAPSKPEHKQFRQVLVIIFTSPVMNSSDSWKIVSLYVLTRALWCFWPTLMKVFEISLNHIFHFSLNKSLVLYNIWFLSNTQIANHILAKDYPHTHHRSIINGY